MNHLPGGKKKKTHGACSDATRAPKAGIAHTAAICVQLDSLKRQPVKLYTGWARENSRDFIKSPRGKASGKVVVTSWARRRGLQCTCGVTSRDRAHSRVVISTLLLAREDPRTASSRRFGFVAAARGREHIACIIIRQSSPPPRRMHAQLLYRVTPMQSTTTSRLLQCVYLFPSHAPRAGLDCKLVAPSFRACGLDC